MKTYIISGIIALFILLAGFGAASLVHPATQNTGNAPGLTSAASQVQIALSNASTTMASLYNGDGKDRIITGLHLFSPQENTTQTITVATSSSASANTGTSITTFAFATTSSPANYSYSVAANSGVTGTATSTANSTNLIWPAGTYLNFIGNGVADASTTIPVQSGVLGSGSYATTTHPFNGFAAVNYIAQ